MSAGRMRRAVVAVAGLVLVAGVALVPPAQVTEAVWNDDEYVAGELEALELAAPVLASVSCSRPSTFTPGATMLTVQWYWPETTAPYDSMGYADTMWTATSSSITGSPTAVHSGPSGGVYTTGFSGSALGDILGGLTGLLLGSTVNVTVQSALGENWESPTKTIVVTIPSLLQGGGISCPNPDG